MRIAIVNKFLYRLGGSQAVVLTETELLRKTDIQLFFFGVNHPNTMENLEERRFFPDHMDLSDAAKQYSLKKRFHFAGRVIYNFQAKDKFGEFLDYYQPDIVHCHNIYNHLSPSILHTAKDRRIPVLMTLHDYHLVCPNYTLKRGLETLCHDRRCYRGKYWNCIFNKCIKKTLSASILGAIRLGLHRRMRWYEKNIKMFIAPSQFIKNEMISDGIPDNQIYHLYNTMPFELSEYMHKLPQKGTITKTQVQNRQGKPFIYVGRLSIEKGLLTLVKAFADLPGQKLWIVGTGPQENEIKRFISKSQATNITLFGYKQREELWGLMQEAYAFCMPSECFEVMPISLIEALALGIPGIGARVGGIPEIIHHHKTGWLFESGNAEALKQTIRESLTIDREKYLQMACQAQAWIEQNHSLKAHLAGLISVYNMVVDSH
jgi:glycosyltransferase involved in cell wall biosynthesis